MSASVYRLYDENDALLYVGCSVNPHSRKPQHCSKPWYRQIARMVCEEFKTRRAAEIAERAAIQGENPLHNVTRYFTAPEPPLHEVDYPQFGPASDVGARMRAAIRDLEECEKWGVSVHSTNWKAEIEAAKSTNKGKRPPFEGLIADTPLEQVEIDDE